MQILPRFVPCIFVGAGFTTPLHLDHCPYTKARCTVRVRRALVSVQNRANPGSLLPPSASLD